MKKYIAFILVLILLLGVLPSKTSFANPDFAGGEGTESKPYQLSTPDQLSNMGKDEYRGFYFELINDIDMDGINWVPIGSYSQAFSVNLNGNNHAIKNLHVSHDRYTQGLFGKIENSTISNLTLTNVQIIDNDKKSRFGSGGLAGIIIFSNITNCSVSGTVRGYHNTGGLIGNMKDNCKIIDCKSKTNVFGSGYRVGGLIGNVEDSTCSKVSLVKNCYSEFSVSGYTVGGLIGKSSWCNITDCLSSSSIETTSGSSGGLIGASNDNTITNCISKSTIQGEHYTGGLIGHSSRDIIKKCQNHSSVTGINAVGGLIGYSGAKLIEDSYSISNNVSGHDYVGGLIGYNFYCDDLQRCYVIGNVEGKNEVGGFIGYTYAVKNLVNCYSQVNVIGIDKVGGFIGNHLANDVANCYSNGTVQGDSNIGGFIGSESSPTVINCFYNQDKASQNNGLAIPKSQLNMFKKETYSNWNFTSVWNIIQESTYPYLSSNTQDPLPSPYKPESIAIMPEEDEIIIGNSRCLQFKIQPSVAPDQRVTWHSSNTSVVNVDENGVITAIKEGTATITVKTVVNNKTDSITINVVKAPIIPKYKYCRVKLNNKTYYDVAKYYTKYNGKRITTLYLANKLADILNNQNNIDIQLKDNAENLTIELTAELIEQLQKQNATITINHKYGVYIINPLEFKLNEISSKLNSTDLGNIKINIKLSQDRVKYSTCKELQSINEYKLQSKMQGINITCYLKKQEYEITEYDSYVKRYFELPEVEKSSYLTMFKIGKELIAQPYKIVELANKYYLEVNTKYNGSYLVVNSKPNFIDLNSWAVANNIVRAKSITEFGEEDKIYMAEFLAALVKTLGLEGTLTQSRFKDNCRYYIDFNNLLTAESYRLVDTEQNKLKPFKIITVAEATRILDKAFETLKLNNKLNANEILSNLPELSNKSTISKTQLVKIMQIIHAEIVK